VYHISLEHGVDTRLHHHWQVQTPTVDVDIRGIPALVDDEMQYCISGTVGKDEEVDTVLLWLVLVILSDWTEAPPSFIEGNIPARHERVPAGSIQMVYCRPQLVTFVTTKTG
jgi:hypothetical protein